MTRDWKHPLAEAERNTPPTGDILRDLLKAKHYVYGRDGWTWSACGVSVTFLQPQGNYEVGDAEHLKYCELDLPIRNNIRVFKSRFFAWTVEETTCEHCFQKLPEVLGALLVDARATELRATTRVNQLQHDMDVAEKKRSCPEASKNE